MCQLSHISGHYVESLTVFFPCQNHTRHQTTNRAKLLIIQPFTQLKFRLNMIRCTISTATDSHLQWDSNQVLASISQLVTTMIPSDHQITAAGPEVCIPNRLNDNACSFSNYHFKMQYDTHRIPNCLQMMIYTLKKVYTCN